jgi:hypothetical protein
MVLLAASIRPHAEWLALGELEILWWQVDVEFAAGKERRGNALLERAVHPCARRRVQAFVGVLLQHLASTHVENHMVGVVHDVLTAVAESSVDAEAGQFEVVDDVHRLDAKHSGQLGVFVIDDQLVHVWQTQPDLIFRDDLRPLIDEVVVPLEILVPVGLYQPDESIFGEILRLDVEWDGLVLSVFPIPPWGCDEAAHGHYLSHPGAGHLRGDIHGSVDAHLRAVDGDVSVGNEVQGVLEDTGQPQ